MIDELSNELKISNNQILRKLFPYSYERLLGEISTRELDILFNQLLSKLKIECLIECGAHGAEMSTMFAKQGGKSIAIEANPFVYENITPKSEGNYKSLNVALSNSNDNLNFYFPINNNKSGQSTFFPKDGIQYDKIEVETSRLDDILKKNLKEIKNLFF
jgi:FkbM family methyltransferase